MKALTLINPWAQAIAHWGKDVENRTWAPPASLVGERIAIHAGKLPLSGAAFDDVQFTVGQLELDFNLPASETTVEWLLARSSAVVCTAVVGQPVRSSSSRWFMGPVGWPLRDVVVLDGPVPCSGAQGMWDLPPDVERAVRAGGAPWRQPVSVPLGSVWRRENGEAWVIVGAAVTGIDTAVVTAERHGKKHKLDWAAFRAEHTRESPQGRGP
jgi:hypothetical protein